MSTGDTRLEIGHVLFLDIVGYSKLLVRQQSELLSELNEVVSGTNEFRQAESAGKLIRLPTGDGMALVFRTNPEAPAQCAMEIARALKSQPAIPLRMGIHSGPVNEVVDVNQRANIAGAGINMAQRVMDCGDTGHILLSQHVADDLVQYRQWAPRLHDLGECEVKHGVRLHLVKSLRRATGEPRENLPPLRLRLGRLRWLEPGLVDELCLEFVQDVSARQKRRRDERFLVKGGASAFLPRRPVRVAWSTFRRQTGPRRILADSVGAMLPACSAGSYQCLSKRRCEES